MNPHLPLIAMALVAALLFVTIMQHASLHQAAAVLQTQPLIRDVR